ncbi:MAG: YceI family protein [Verrucomicrobia bacterium]|nr:YceI family protein [Verrucomicrobiota bacterium]MCH8511369.1 YceI family protein [Kiritimatiellia bacterium]
MKYIPLFSLLALFLLTQPLTNARAESWFLPSETVPSRIQVDGTSNVRDWDVATEDVQGRLHLSKDGFWTDTGLDVEHLPLSADAGLSFVVEIPASSVKSDNRRFNSNLHDYMNVEKHKQIRFAFKSLEVKAEEKEDADPNQIETQVTGELSLAGVTQTITFPVTWIRKDQTLVLKGEVAFKMSLFDIDPPRMMMGALRTADEVQVAFSWVLEPGENPEKVSETAQGEARR